MRKYLLQQTGAVAALAPGQLDGLVERLNAFLTDEERHVAALPVGVELVVLDVDVVALRKHLGDVEAARFNREEAARQAAAKRDAADAAARAGAEKELSRLRELAVQAGILPAATPN